MKHPFTAFALIALLVSCDYVDQPLGDNAPPPPPPSDVVPRRVLLEKFTGHTCTFCPEGEDIANGLQDFYGSDKLILASIHQGNFAELVAPIGDGMYDTDFTTADGDAYGATFSPSAYPQGMVDRVRVNNSWTFSRNAWDARVGAVINQPAQIDVEIVGLEHDAGAISASVKVKVVEDLDPVDYSLTLYLLESGIIDWQTNGNATPSDVPNYEHNHVLRGALNGTWGQAFVADTVAVGDSVTVDITGLAVPSNVLNISNCEVVAYVYRNDTYEILQVHARNLEP